MSIHELNALHIVHLSAVLVMLAFTFYGFAAPLETRKWVLALTGTAALIVAATGLRMWQGLYDFTILGWIIVKIVCWLGLAGLGGMAYRRREQKGVFMTLLLGLAILAVAMVYAKPF